MDHNKLWKILKEMGLQNYLTCQLRNLYAGQEITELTWNKKRSKLGKEQVYSLYL